MANTPLKIKTSLTSNTPAALNIGEPAYSYSSNILFIGSITDDGAIPIGGWDSYIRGISAYEYTNAAYRQANSGFIHANSGFIHANAGFIHANAGFIHANSGFIKTNSSYDHANAAYNAANQAVSTNVFITFSANGTNVVPNSNTDTLYIRGTSGVLITGNDGINTINVGLTELAQGNSGLDIYVSPNGDDNYDGLAKSRPKRTVRAAVNAARPGMSVNIMAGIYDEVTPIIIPQKVQVTGEGERTTIIRPVDPTKDIFWLNNNCMVTQMAFENYTATACAFPAATIASGTSQTGSVSGITLQSNSDSLNDFYTEMQIEIVSGTGAGQTKNITSYNGTTKVATVDTNWSTPPDNGSQYVIRIPRRTTPAANTSRYSTYITASPYVYVCSSRTTTGTGLKVDGALSTGNKSIISAQFTQVNSGGNGLACL